MALYSSDLLFKDLNKEAEEVLGYSKKQILNKSILEVNASGEFNIDENKLISLLNGETKSYTVQRSSNHKREKYSAFTTTLIADGANKHIIGVFHRNDEDAIDLSFISDEFNNIERILSLNPDLHYIMDIDSRKYIYQNVNILNFFGYTKEDLNGANEIEFLISKIDESTIRDVALANHKLKTEKNRGEFVEVEYRFLSKHEGWKWLRAKTTPLKQDKKASKVNLSYGILQDITRRKEIQEKFNDQKVLLDNIAEAIPEIIKVFDLSIEENIYSNFKGKTFLGFSEKEWLETKPNKIKTDLLHHIKCNLEKLKALEPDGDFTKEFQYNDINGDAKWIVIKAKVLSRDNEGTPIQVLCILSDIDKQKRDRDRLFQSRNTMKAILHALPDLILVLNKDGYYKKVLPGVDFKLENPNEIIGKHVQDVLDEKTSIKILNKICACIASGETQYLNFKRKHDNGDSDRYFSNHFSKVNDEEVLVIVRDETQKKLAELNIEEKVLLLSKQNEQMESFIEKNSELERFAYIISHDLKEPLRSINAISELIDIEVKKSGNDKLENLLGHLAQNSARMIDLIEGVLEYSKIGHEIIAKDVNIDDLVKSVLKDLDKAIHDKFVQINCVSLPTIKGDEIQLRQLFQNIIGNAIKFNDSISPSVEIGYEMIDAKATFYIKDNGIGVPEHFKNVVFQMGKRVHSYMNYPGQGLGLTISKKIVERHGGKLWIDDNQPSGSIFYFTLSK